MEQDGTFKKQKESKKVIKKLEIYLSKKDGRASDKHRIVGK
jgi:hypothetical protein